MISQTAEYALRAMTCLAGEYNKPLTTQQIADAAHIPVGYLYKVLQSLGRAGLVQSTRGLHGGYVLSLPPEDISILRVVQAVDPIQRIKVCPLNLKSHSTRLCPLHRRLDEAAAMVEHAFAQTTLAELLHPGPGAFPRPLCDCGHSGKKK
ncbi:MAG TPA: Rrf2 family transcriptional regulator [Chloroflexota bacterium]|nr:Rrf2 family transcriptional regulator [Chloroflexota bacterium]